MLTIGIYGEAAEEQTSPGVAGVLRYCNATGDGPQARLAGFRGLLQADAFSGYDALYATGNVTEVGW